MLDHHAIAKILQERISTHALSSLSAFPHPFELGNLKEACALIVKTMQEKKRILVIGDYDADGIVSTAIMTLFFQAIQYPHFECAIPNRFEDGYGISIPLIQRHQSDLILTVDNGITAIEPAQYCKQNQIPLIITDHHTPKSTLPDALIVNPKVCHFLQEDICGAFVAWYLCAGIKATLGLSLSLTPFLELVGIATISDVMPLVDLNYLALKKALCSFKAPHFVFSKFFHAHYKRIDEEKIGFYIAPLLNAAGRMAKANEALDFLLSPTLQEAKIRFQVLQDLNTQRKEIQAQITQDLPSNLTHFPHCLIAYSQDWHEGVLGILASKLCEEYQKSAFVFTKKHDVLKGSARSPQGVQLLQSLHALGDLILDFGGHAKAAGLTLSPQALEAFGEAFLPHTQEEDMHKLILGELSLEVIDHSLMRLINAFAPYGEANPRPLFKARDFQILECKYVGKDKNHTMLKLKTPRGKELKAMAFFSQLSTQECQSFTFSLAIDEFSRSPMLLIRS